MDINAAEGQKILQIDWQNAYDRLVLILNELGFSIRGIEYGPVMRSKNKYAFPDFEVHSGFYYPDRKVSFFAISNPLMREPKVILINLYQNQHGGTLVNISQSDPSESRGWQVAISRSGYKKLINSILMKL